MASSPGWPLGYVPPPAEWNTLWASKVDVASTAPAVVAAAGTTQGTATVLSAQFNIITTVAAGTGVVANSTYTKIWNFGANDLKVYPLPTMQFNTEGTNIPILVPVGGVVETIMIPGGTQGYAR